MGGSVFLWMLTTEAGVERTIWIQGHDNSLKMISSRPKSVHNNKREKNVLFCEKAEIMPKFHFYNLRYKSIWLTSTILA